MTTQFTASIVRILGAGGRVGGAGFLISDRHAITCAHVVADALGVRGDSAEPPTAQVSLDFPLLAPGKVLLGHVVLWRALQSDGATGGEAGEDIAVLELQGEVPQGSRPARLVTTEDLWKHSFRAFGFPVGYDKGVWASGELRARQASGWVQIEDTKLTGYFVAQGFSGAPVWDEQADGVVGMVVVAERRADIRAAFIIPTDTLIESWPALAEAAIRACPYRGLFAFREEDAPHFFGREVFTERLAESVQRKPLVAVIGPSGSGKSSVVFAGLVPSLRKQGGWLTASFRPGDQPLRVLVAALLPLLEPHMSEGQRLDETGRLADGLARGAFTLRELVERVVRKVPDARRLLLVVDQFEEVYTLCRNPEERARFIDVLTAAAGEESRRQERLLTIAVTMRADFLGRALSYRPLADALQDADLKLGPMTRAEMESAIEQPARAMGVQVEDGLTDRILDAVVAEPGNLPLLEFALTLLWARQRHGNLTHAAYDEIGGVEKALAGYAEEVYSGLAPEEQERVRGIFTQLVRPGEGTEDTRRVAAREEVREENWDLAARLADARLVVTGRDEAAGGETVEIVHEALIRGWDRLRAWVEADRKFLTWQDRLRAALHVWESGGKPDDSLLRGAPLGEADQWLRERGSDLGPAERDFIGASVALQRRERQTRERLRRNITLGLAGGLVVALLLAGLAGLQWLRAEDQVAATLQQQRVALSRALASQALSQVDTQYDLALLLGAESRAMSDTVEARGALLDVLNTNNLLDAFLQDHTGAVNAVAYSPDGKLIASASEDQSIIVWDAATRRPVGEPLTGHGSPVRCVAFSPDGKVLASADEEGSIRLWDAATHAPLGEPLTGHENTVRGLAFSPDGTMLASASEDQTIRLWDVTAREPVGEPLTGHKGSVYALAFSPDGTMLASTSEDNTGILWDVDTRLPIGDPMTGPTKPLYSIAFSPDGKLLAAGGEDTKLYLIDLTTQPITGTVISEFSTAIRGVTFSPDSKTLVTVSDDTLVRLWHYGPDYEGKVWWWQAGTFTGHKAEALGVAFSPDGKTLASCSEDGTVILWDVEILPTSRAPRLRLAEALVPGTNDTGDMAFSPDGKLLASGQLDRNIILWDVAARKRAGELSSGSNPYSGFGPVTFSPDGKTLASADRNLMLWDVATRQRTDLDYSGSGYTLAYSPDGKVMASATDDRNVLIWDVAAQKLVEQLLVDAEAESKIGRVVFSPDGKLLVAAVDDGTLRFWNTGTYQRVGEPLDAGRAVQWMAFSPDSAVLAAAGDDATITLWDPDKRSEPLRTLRGHKNTVYSLAFSPDGRTLASASQDGTVILWDMATGQRIGRPLTNNDHNDQPRVVQFSPDGKMLASTWNGPEGVLLWDLDPASWHTRPCEIAGRNLTTEEWQQYLGGEPYRKTCPDYP